MIITFVGHGSLRISQELTEKITDTIKNNVKDQKFVSFYCGGYGDFDNHCAAICRRLRNEIPPCEIVFVTPYITPSQQERLKYLIDSKLYTATIYPPIETVPPRFAITKRNEWMIESADLVIACVSRTYGGAYKTLEYARRKKKSIINLADP